MKYYSLTTPQQNIWNLQKYYSDTAISNLCGAIFYKEKRDSERLCRAICKFIESQSGMRLRFCEKEKPTQYISEEIEKNIPVLTFISMKEFDRYAEEFAHKPIGLAEGAMYRFVVFQVGDKSGVLFSVSHLIADAWTCALMANKVDGAYRMIGQDADFELPHADYRFFIEEEKNYRASERCQKDKAYWEKKYTVRSDGTVPFEKSPIKTHIPVADNIEAKRTTRTLPPTLEQKVKVYCRRHSVTPAALFETAVIIYLSKINPENGSITIGVPVLNRSGAKEKGTAGMFISTMPLTIEVGKEVSVPELTGRIVGEHMGIFRHQRYPYGDILQMCRERSDSFEKLSGNLYDVLVSYQNATTDTEADTKWYFSGYSEIPLAVHIDNRDGKECHTLNVDYQTRVFSEEEADHLLDRLELILGQIAEDGEKKLKDISIITDTEYRQVTETFNDTAVDYPREKCVHELFEEQAGKTPDRTALVFHDRKFTYKELDAMSNSLAHELKSKGIGRGDVVPIIAKRSWHIVVAMFAILKTGAAYMPVSPEYPEDRIISMLETAKSRIALTCGFGGKPGGVECMELETVDYEKDAAAVANVSRPEDLCYVIFTSGSTGTPKGVSIDNRNVVNYCANNNNNNVCHRIVKNEYRRIVSVTNFVFDIFVTETLLPLLNGMTVYFADEEESMRQDKLAGLVEREKIEVIQTTPTKMRSFLLDKERTDYLKNFKAVILGGEAFPSELYRELREHTDAHIFNIYGPAETTVWSSNAEVTGSDITIGRPIANTQIYIVDEDLGILPIGVAGELCIAGDGVGLGYLNRPKLTAERFVPNPFATEENGHGKTMYRTGDLARWRGDGEIEYLGRIDTQVKIRGLRIELGEIESIMSGYPGIALCAVSDKKDENGRQYLVGYYTPSGSGEAGKVDGKELRKHLSGKLPSYMIPNYFMELEAMPMTPSGKLDRKNLPVPDFKIQEESYVAPETDTEVRLAGIWKKLLKLPQIGKEDDFFALGGDSLLAISLLSELEAAFSIRLSIKELMENPALGQMARVIEQAGKEADIIVPQHKNRYILLPQQKVIYAACQKEPDSLLYNMPAKIDLPEDIDRDKLKAAICQVMEHHKILRTHIVSEADEVYGVYEENTDLIFEEYTAEEEKEFVRPFALDKAPLFRVGFSEDVLLFDIHHIIADGETLNVILRDIVRAYQGQGLAKEEVWYGDYAEYFRQTDFSSHKDYFREMLKCDFEGIELPPAKDGGTGGGSLFYEISERTVKLAKKYATENGLTDTMVFFGTYGILLSKYTAKKEILSSAILQNRVHRDVKDMAGMFVNTLPVYFEVAGNTEKYFMRAKEILLGLYQYQELPFLEIADAVGMQDKSVINTSFVYQADGAKKLILDGQSLSPEFVDTHTAKFDFSMELTPVEDRCRMRLEYDCAKYDHVLMAELAGAYIRILEQLNKERIADISVLTEDTYHKVVENFNDTAVDYLREKCVHELFTEQAARTPERTALVFEDKRFTYRQLDEMSNSLALFLRDKGIVVGDKVAVLLKRDESVIMAQLAVLKLGAVFIPIDNRYPRERIEYILLESQAKLIVRNRENKFKFLKESVIEEWDSLEIKKFDSVHVSSNKPCYIIFTSGSTGQPKGCVLTNRGIVNFCINNNILETCNQLNEQVCVSVNTISFDFFIAESLLPLLNGYTVVLASEEESTNQKMFSELVVKNCVNVIQTTPTRFKMYFSEKGDLIYTRQLKVIITSGEVLSLDLLQCFVQNTDAAIFNPLGPSECSVWAAGGKLHLSREEVADADITIGRPIANTQIYIVDKELNLLPIGVAGELCIAGDGVGLGYLNRPELTAERFVPNPFATEENGHGKTMYRTGDLARWRADGEIEYLGRIDTQVKIRGLRIELGEIESVMSGYPGIALCAVSDKKDENGRQYLVGYYTTVAEETGQVQREEARQDGDGSCAGEGPAVRGADTDEKKLREHLASKLPRYMIPNYFMCLDAMPMTPSGKLDRKNLPVPDFSAQGMEYLVPKDERERILCCIVGELLGVERFGAGDDFFLSGGDSLTAIVFVARAHDAGVDFALQNVFDHPTVRSLCEWLDAGTAEAVHYEAEEFEKYRGIFAANVIDDAFSPKKRELGNVLLTGATGFLGAHVLDALMREEGGKIYCLVRSGREDDRRGRLREVLRYYFGERYEEEIGRRIILVVGDIEREWLGDVPSDVQTVIHTAASVKHFGSYAYFHKVNCEGTRHVAEYAKKMGAKLIHISTLSVSGNSMADDFTVYRSEEEKFFDETCLYIGQPLGNVYIHSKFEAERAVYDAILDGLDAKVIRVGNLTNRVADYKFQPNYKENAFLTRVKAVLEFGLFPDYLMSLYSEFSPVDQTAEGIIKIAQYADGQSVFHLNSNRPIYFDRFLKVLREIGIKMKVVRGDDFYAALRQTMKDAGTEYIFEALQNDMDEEGKLVYDSNIRIENDFTVWFMKRLGFEWSEIDVEYIRGYVEYFKEVGYLRV